MTQKIKAIHNIILHNGSKHLWDTEGMKSVYLNEVISLTLKDGTERKTGFVFIENGWTDTDVVFDYVIKESNGEWRAVGSCPVKLLSENSIVFLLEKLKKLFENKK